VSKRVERFRSHLLSVVVARVIRRQRSFEMAFGGTEGESVKSPAYA
jgi:hypothetical protein